MPRKAHASPTKEFFVFMITKDITLQACILDLVDNSVDGARDDLRRIGGRRSEETLLEGYNAEITLSREGFRIEDNCGGITIADAVNYAFHFGRRPGAAPEADFAIGLYGIGMKRAIFKMGKQFTVKSSTREEAFSVDVDVDDWLTQKKRITEEDGTHVEVDDWDFPLEEQEVWERPGTVVEVTNLYAGVEEEFSDSNFRDNLIMQLRRDYAFIIQKGFRIQVNGIPVEPYIFEFRVGDKIRPATFEYSDQGVRVRLTAGIAAPPQDDVEAESELRYDPQYSGWYVLCNDRVVLAADKSERTGWGTAGLARWHSQFNGFVGIVRFDSTDPGALPWDTTKRDIEATNPVYRRALKRMKEAARPYLAYTNRRKSALTVAKKIEALAEPRSYYEVVRSLPQTERMELPELPEVAKITTITIRYSKPLEELDAVKEALGDGDLSAAEVGVRTFNYYRDRFVGR